MKKINFVLFICGVVVLAVCFGVTIKTLISYPNVPKNTTIYTQIEYKLVKSDALDYYIEHNTTKKGIEIFLNKNGMLGWDLAGKIFSGESEDGCFFIFKRNKIVNLTSYDIKEK